MKCFYHNADLDGICSAAVVKHKFPTCELFGINHGDVFPLETIVKDEEVYMVDFSLPGDEMLKLDQESALIWIDHHKTAIDRLSGENIKGLRSIGAAACKLAWMLLFPNITIPRAVQLLSDWDIWNHTDRDCKPFQYGMRLETHSPTDKIWEHIFTDEDSFNMILDQGQTIVAYTVQDAAYRMEHSAFVCEFEGLKCLAVNQSSINSLFFESMWDEAIYDAMISFGFHGGIWTISMYATKVDVSKIAVKFGGGGHEHACGFTCEKLPEVFGGAA